MKDRDSSTIEIVEYKSEYKEAFKSLNQEWIETYFKMEEEDYKALDNPDEYIIQKVHMRIIQYIHLNYYT